MLGDVRTLAQATDAKDAGVTLVQDAASRIDRVRLAVRAAQPVGVAALEWLDPVFVAGHWTPQLIEYAGGFDVLGAHWDTMEKRAAEYGTAVDRRRWRLVGPMHIAETDEQARKDVEFGLADWIGYFREVAALPIAPETDDTTELVDAMNASGIAVIGTPDTVLHVRLPLLARQAKTMLGAWRPKRPSTRSSTVHSRMK